LTVLILAAGYAVRLKELTQDNPKPLLVVAGKTIIDRILEKVKGAGPAGKVYLITNAKFFGKFRDWHKASRYGAKVELIDDGSVSNETRLGAIRDIYLAIEKKAIDDDLLVIAGDNLFDFDLAKFRIFASSKVDGVSVAVHDIKDRDAAARKFGVVMLDDDGVVADFEEKPEDPKSALISTGIYYFPRAKLSLIRDYVRTSDRLDAPGYYISWMVKNDKVYGFTFSEDWYDIGDIESYRKADSTYSKKEN